MRSFLIVFKWIYDAIDQIRGGASTADVARVWPTAQEMGFNNEQEAFVLQFAHGSGLGLWEKPVISRLLSLDHPYELKEGMTFAIETWCPSEDGTGFARIEEEVVVRKDGAELITKFPAAAAATGRSEKDFSVLTQVMEDACGYHR